jgi:hypothetical protein
MPATETYDPQELARRFNEDEAVWRSFESKRQLRALLGPKFPLTDEAAEKLDWLAAERENRTISCVGRTQS